MSTLLYAPQESGTPGAEIKPGQLVLTVDNTKLGVVKEVTGTHFKVDVRFRRDYWLSRDLVAFVDDRALGLAFRSDETELYKEHSLGAFDAEFESPNDRLTRWENGPFPP